MYEYRAELQRLILGVAKLDVSVALTQTLEGNYSLGDDMVVVAINDGKPDKRQVRKYYMKDKLLIPDRIEGVLIEGLCLLFTTVTTYP